MTFSVQLPRTLAEGLAGKTVVEKPMLFVFPEVKVHTMWMKGMLIPIDIVFADASGTIVKVYSNVPPKMGPKYSSIVPSKYAIECAAGDASRLGLEEGRRIRIFRDLPNLD
jgi:uncharacterized membrane protein (UPF0127 family)